MALSVKQFDRMEEKTGNISAKVTGCVLDVSPACETSKVPRASSQTLQTSVSRLKVKIYARA